MEESVDSNATSARSESNEARRAEIINGIVRHLREELLSLTDSEPYERVELFPMPMESVQLYRMCSSEGCPICITLRNDSSYSIDDVLGLPAIQGEFHDLDADLKWCN